MRLSTTSHAILGMLAFRPATAYELAKGMGTNFTYFWPRARSHVLAEVKRLADLGLARAQSEPTGRRARTVYSLTPEGRRALERWMATPPTAFGLEIEGLVRVFLAPFGSVDDLAASLEATRAEAVTMLNMAAGILEQYSAGTAPAQEHIHVRALLIDFLTHFAECTEAWAERSLATVREWDDLSPTGKEQAARRTLAAMPRGMSAGGPAVETWGNIQTSAGMSRRDVENRRTAPSLE